jgi:hypothetical protein
LDFCFRVFFRVKVRSDSERIFDENKRNAPTSLAFIIPPRCIGLINIEAVYVPFTQFNNYSEKKERDMNLKLNLFRQTFALV